MKIKDQQEALEALESLIEYLKKGGTSLSELKLELGPQPVGLTSGRCFAGVLEKYRLN